MHDLATRVEQAGARIEDRVRRTPVEEVPLFPAGAEGRVLLKLENFQVTGSFKIRGAVNKVRTLPPGALERGVVTASSGNHGAAVAWALRSLGRRAVIFVPRHTAPTKLAALRALGAEVVLFGEDCVEAEKQARAAARAAGKTYISPYNDPEIVAGQGTVGLELAEQVGAVDAVLVPVGGGGLVSGVAGYLKARGLVKQVIGCQPEHSAVMSASVKAGRILELPSKPTLSDGTAGGIEEGAITFDLCRRWVDAFVRVSEEEIRQAILFYLERLHMLVEGAGALSLAAFLKQRPAFEGRTVVLVVSGAKLGLDVLRGILAGGGPAAPR